MPLSKFDKVFFTLLCSLAQLMNYIYTYLFIIKSFDAVGSLFWLWAYILLDRLIVLPLLANVED